ncbi:hypothetical protein Tco_0447873 [Tanacetum coccineum]
MKTPISSDMKLTKDEECESIDSTKYRGMIGSLLYLMASSPDIMFSVCLCARFQEDPKTSHLEAFRRRLTTKGVGLRVADSHIGNHREDDFTPLETIRRFLEMDFKSFMMEGIDGEFHFLPEGGAGDEGALLLLSLLTVKLRITLINRTIAEKAQNRKVSASLKAAGKRKQTAESFGKEPHDPDIHELKDSTDWVVAHVTPPSWKQHLKEISLEKLYDIHDIAYMRQAILDNMLNNRTRKFMSTLLKARASCNAIREREIKKDKAYAKLEWKCNDGFMASITGLFSRIRISDKMGLLVARLVKAAMFHSRCTTFEEVAALKEPFDLEKMPGYRPFSKKEFDQAGDDLATTSYPFIAEAIVDPYASLEVLISKNPKSLHAKLAPSTSKPSSSKAPNLIS